MTAEDIPWLPVKGIVSAYAIYGDPAERPLADIDLRARPSDFDRIVRMARSRGWEVVTGTPRLWEAIFTVDGWQVDLECTLGPPGLCALSIDDLLGRARSSIEPFGFPHLQPELHDHALVLVLNAFKDGLHTTPWALQDLSRMVQEERFDSDLLASRARLGHVASILWIVADWLAETHGAREWGRVREAVGRRPPSSRVARSYLYARKRGWPPKVGLFIAASASDYAWRGLYGLLLAGAGIARRRIGGARPTD
jgi:hypothetical protein